MALDTAKARREARHCYSWVCRRKLAGIMESFFAPSRYQVRQKPPCCLQKTFCDSLFMARIEQDPCSIQRFFLLPGTPLATGFVFIPINAIRRTAPEFVCAFRLADHVIYTRSLIASPPPGGRFLLRRRLLLSGFGHSRFRRIRPRQRHASRLLSGGEKPKRNYQ